MADDASKLSDSDLQAGLANLPDWQLEGGAITRTFKFPDFVSAMAFANKVADIAEDLNHHPDLTVGWGRCGVMFTTHDAGGLTSLDLDAARRVDAIDG
jgi:4a-hydroxytetrahydrobiopterin dehydratase